MLISGVCARRCLLSYCFLALEAEGKRLMAAVCNETAMNALSEMARRTAGLRYLPYK